MNKLNEEVSFGGVDEKELEEEIRDKVRINGEIQGPMKYTPIKLTEERKQKMLASYGTVCINDFGDDYNLTDAERKKINMYYTQQNKIMKCQSKYRRIDKFVMAWRTILEAMRVVANNNKEFFEEDEFLAGALKGKIKLGGFMYPRYCGSDKKKLDWEVISEYILNLDKDPADLIQKASVSNYDIVDVTEKHNRLLMEEMMVGIKEVEKLYEETEKKIILDEDEYQDGVLAGMVIEDLSKKEFKKLLRLPGTIDALKASKRYTTNSNSSEVKQYAFEFDEDDFEMIQRMDEERGFTSSSDMPKFKGSMLNKRDVEAYMFELERWEEDHIKVEYMSRYRTLAEIREIQNKQALEDAGYNLKRFYSYDADRKKLEKIAKKDEKKEKRLQRRLIKLNQRINARKGINTKKKKHKKKDKTGYKKAVIKETERMFSSGFDSFDEYTKQMEGWDE